MKLILILLLLCCVGCSQVSAQGSPPVPLMYLVAIQGEDVAVIGLDRYAISYLGSRATRVQVHGQTFQYSIDGMPLLFKERERANAVRDSLEIVTLERKLRSIRQRTDSLKAVKK